MLALLTLSLLPLAGCGGSSSGATGSATGKSTESSSSTEGSSSTESSPPTEGSSTSSSPPPSSSRTSPPTPGFSKKAKPAAFGYEAAASDREEASDILEKSFKARAAQDYATQCKTLSQRILKAIEKSRYAQNCVNTLKIEDLLIPPQRTANPMQGPIAALRVQGSLGYAIFHGKGGQDYAMRMELENGKWKVGEVVTARLP